MEKIGFSSCCFPTTKSIEEIIEFCLDQQFNAMELEVNQTNFDPENLRSETRNWIERLSASSTISFGIHSPGDINFSDPLPEKRIQAEEKVIKSIRLAADLGASNVVVHPGRVVGEFTQGKLDVALGQNVGSIRKCAQFAQASGVKISVENLCHEKNSVNPNIVGFFEMCKQIDLSLIKITLDTNHAGLVDGIEKSVSVVGDYVDYIHFSSNKGKKSDHCEPGEGVIDFYAIADFLKKFSGMTIIELNENGEESAGAILRTRNYLHDLQNHATQ
jgi:sugar phosphate isomerase/epimerase